MEIPYKERISLSDNEFIEIDIKEMATGLKYSLVLIRSGKRIVGFDNHENKPPHKHIKGKEYPYEFISVYQLVEDFYEEIQKFVDIE